MEPIIDNLVKAVGWSILHSLWQGAVIYMLLFIVLMAWPKINARLKHNLAFGSLFLIFASFCFTFFSIFEIPVTGYAATKTTAALQISYQQLLTLTNGLNFKTEAYFPIIVFVYGAGVIFQLAILLTGYFKLKGLKRVSRIAVPEAWVSIFETTLTQLRINKTVRFYLSSKVNVPLVIGFFRPVVLFPVALATQLDIKQVEAILIHELSHIRRNDYLINLVKTCIETLMFFNPFVWLTTRFIHIEREHSCDDLVVNFTGTPLTYAHALLKLELLKDKQSPALSLAATGNNQHLYQRIKRITNMKTNYINAKQQFFILTLVIATVFSLAWINPSKKTEPAASKLRSIREIVASVKEKSIKEHLTLNSDTDSTKTKKKGKSITISKDGKTVTYTDFDDLPDSLKKVVMDLDKKFNSPEWKENMAKIELNAKEIEKKFNSPEWKEQMKKMELNTKELEKKFNSPEWKEHMAKLELTGKELAKKFESPEWKEHLQKIELNSKDLEKKFNSPEWKAHMQKIELNSKELEKKFNSPEWKENMQKIELNAKELEKKFNSPEWKKQVEGIELNAKELEKKFNSPEWKKKIEEQKKLQATPEYKELREKFEKDLQELKKKKGLDNQKVSLINMTGSGLLAAINVVKDLPGFFYDSPNAIPTTKTGL